MATGRARPQRTGGVEPPSCEPYLPRQICGRLGRPGGSAQTRFFR